MPALCSFRSRLSAIATVWMLSACGGGLYLTVGEDDPYPPVVSLAAQSTTAQAGSTLRLIAAAADESGIDYVNFFRYDGNTPVGLGSDAAEPYEWNITVPSDGRTSVTVFAQAVDAYGNSATSAPVTIAITP